MGAVGALGFDVFAGSSAEAYGLTQDEELRPKVEKAVEFIVKAQNERDGGKTHDETEVETGAFQPFVLWNSTFFG